MSSFSQEEEEVEFSRVAFACAKEEEATPGTVVVVVVLFRPRERES